MQKFLGSAVVGYVASALARNAKLFSATVVFFKQGDLGSVLSRAYRGKKSCRSAAYYYDLIYLHKRLSTVGVVDVVFVPYLFKLLKSYSQLVLLFARYRNYERVDDA